MAAHFHKFHDDEWPFQDAVNTAAFTTHRVVNENCPILAVLHEHNGDWQFFSETTTSKKGLLIICLGCVFEKDRTIGEVADLPFGWKAWRETPSSAWERAEVTAISKSQQLAQSLRETWSRLVHVRRAGGG
jgi:hypothetical protein